MIRPYIGRFAPSPTGPLHFGSLVAALASWLDAKHHNGKWLVRIEDIDPPREVAGASDQILRSLHAHGLIADQPLTYQSQRSDFYENALSHLQNNGAIYGCDCSRKRLNGQAYDGYCRTRQNLVSTPYALRAKVTKPWVDFEERISEPGGQIEGDFIVRRKDQLYAYQLAVTVDDALQGVTHIVRGDDLIDSTPMQVWLQKQLGYPQIAYAHLMTVKNAQGQKLSKQTGANALSNTTPAANILAALQYLRQPIPEVSFDVDKILQFASKNWQIDRLNTTQ